MTYSPLHLVPQPMRYFVDSIQLRVQFALFKSPIGPSIITPLICGPFDYGPSKKASSSSGLLDMNTDEDIALLISREWNMEFINNIPKHLWRCKRWTMRSSQVQIPSLMPNSSLSYIPQLLPPLLVIPKTTPRW